MQLVRTLALVAVLCGACVTAQDNGATTPPPSPSPAPSPPPPTTPPPTTASVATSTTPAPAANTNNGTDTPAPTTATPGAATPAPTPAVAIATENKDGDGFQRVQLAGKLENLQLTIEGEKVVVESSSGSPVSFPTTEKMRVLVGANTSMFQLLTLQSDVVTELEIGSYEETRETRIAFSGFGAENVKSLSALSFTNINFYTDVVKLVVPTKLAYLKINGSNVVDMSLSSTNLNQVEFINSGFKNFPFLLYQRKYPSPVKINSNVVISADYTELSPLEYEYAQHNLGENASSIFNFVSSCDGVTNRSATDLEARHVVCNDSRREKVRRFNSANFILPDETLAPTPAPTTRGSDSNTTLTVIVIVIAVVAAVLAYFVARRYFCTSSSLSGSPRLNERTVGLISKDESHAAHNKLSFISSDDALRQIRLEQQEVSVNKSVGTGRLWVGDYSGRKVMIKRIEAESNDSYATKALITQARSLAPLSHPNIVGLVGVTWVQGTDFGVVGEFVEKGTLKSMLMDLDTELDLQTKLHMCLDIAQALKYLHSSERNMYMKRLNSRKVLVNGAMECKLNLFECHPCTNKMELPEVFGAGDMAWEAPELITRTGVLDPRKINMFSLGVLIGEIMTRVSPYQSTVDNVGHTLADLELAKRIKRQERLVPHKNRREFSEMPSVLRDVVERCLAYQPLSRPTVEEVVQCLESVKDYSERVGSTTSL